MKKDRVFPILKVLCFAVIFFLVLFCASYILRPSITMQGNNERLGLLGYYAEPENTIDVLYLGSSDATAFWSPWNAWQTAGFTSYTYGKSMLRASMFEGLLDEALKTQDPSVVVVSVRTILQSGSTVEETALRSVTDALPYSTLNRWKMISRNRGQIVLTANDVENDGTGEPDRSLFGLLPFYFDIMKYHENWQNIWEGSFNYRLLGSFRSNTKGFLIGTGSQSQTRDSSVSGIRETLALDSTAEEALLSLMKRARRDGFEMLFVMPPYCETESDRMLYNRAAEIISGAGFELVDFNEYFTEIGLDVETDYYDPGHTNFLGAVKYTEYLIRWLKEHYDLPDHRGDPSFADWTDGLAEWEKLETEAVLTCLSRRNSVFYLPDSDPE